MRIFFSGYGWWFYKHKINNSTYSILSPCGTPILSPFDDERELHTSNTIRTVNHFYLERDDNIAYSNTKKITHVKKLLPSHDGEPGDTLPGIIGNLQLGGRGISTHDCFFIIDYDQSPEFVFPDDKIKQLEAIEPKEVANTERPKNKKSLGDTNLIRITNLREFCLQLITDKNGEKATIKAINPKDQLPFHIPCTQDMILKALQNWSKKQGIKKHACIWQTLEKGMDKILWSSPERKSICTALKQGNKNIDINFLKKYLP